MDTTDVDVDADRAQEGSTMHLFDRSAEAAHAGDKRSSADIIRPITPMKRDSRSRGYRSTPMLRGVCQEARHAQCYMIHPFGVTMISYVSIFADGTRECEDIPERV